MQANLNTRLTRIGPGTPCGQLMRQYWQPVALVDEFDAALDPKMALRPIKAVRLLGQDLVLFKTGDQTYGLLDRDCPHRGADLAFARFEPAGASPHNPGAMHPVGIRCPFHGWKFAADGSCLETPAEPENSSLCTRVRQRSYPTLARAGIIYAWLGDAGSTPPELPNLDCYQAPQSHSFAFKGLWRCNWLQAFEVGIDPAHPSFLHRYFEDESTDGQFGKQFRGASAGEVDGEKWPMTRVMRECFRADIRVDAKAHGLGITTLRRISEQLTHVRTTQALFPHSFIIPLSETITITQCHVPVDDVTTYWYTIFTSYDQPLNQATMRAQRLQTIELPDYVPKVGAHNAWGHNPQEQQRSTYLGMGEDINVHDQWAVESPGPIADRTREHLGTSDKVIMAYRRQLQAAIDSVERGEPPPRMDANASMPTFDSIEQSADWQHPSAAKEARRTGNASWKRTQNS